MHFISAGVDVTLPGWESRVQSGYIIETDTHKCMQDLLGAPVPSNKCQSVLSHGAQMSSLKSLELGLKRFPDTVTYKQVSCLEVYNTRRRHFYLSVQPFPKIQKIEDKKTERDLEIKPELTIGNKNIWVYNCILELTVCLYNPIYEKPQFQMF